MYKPPWAKHKEEAEISACCLAPMIDGICDECKLECEPWEYDPSTDDVGRTR